MNTNKDLILSILVGAIVFSLIIVVGYTMINSQEQGWIYLCESNDWKNVTLHGDFGGELDCQKYWDDNYANGKWGEKCSTMSYFLKHRDNCHTLCNIDCKMKNKVGGPICVC